MMLQQSRANEKECFLLLAKIARAERKMIDEVSESLTRTNEVAADVIKFGIERGMVPEKKEINN